MSVEVRRGAHGLEVVLGGDWSGAQFTAHAAALEAVDFGAPDLGGGRELEVRLDGAALDLSGAWLLHCFLGRARAAGVRVVFQGEPPPQLALIERSLAEGSAPAPAAAPPQPSMLARIGLEAVLAGAGVYDGVAFLGRLAASLGRAAGSLRRLRPISIARHLYDTGITAIPIVALIAFLISVIIAYMSAQQLRGLGVDIYVVDLVTLGVLRELGVLLTAVIVAGRSGSAFAAELGSMKLNEEVDALVATGVDPYEVLIAPRVLALVLALPLLTVIADMVGLAGGALLCRFLLDMPLTQYVHRVNTAISDTTFWVGIIKAPVFALLIAVAGCYRGLQVRGSARELGRLVTVAVVQAIFFVILADALFAVFFMEIDV